MASADLPPGKAMPLQLEGQQLALWRSASGQLAVWEDRCPHRGMRLSFGAVLRDRLICPYHGWAFGEDGQCRHIPAHANLIPALAARARALNVHEAGGYIWVNLSSVPFQGQEEIEALTLSPLRALYIDRPADEVIAALVGQGGVRADLSAVAPLVRFHREAGDDAIFIQRLDDKNCMLHAATIGTASAARRHEVNERLVEFRLALATQPAISVEARAA